MQKKNNLLLAVPFYNEEKKIKRCLQQLLKYRSRIKINSHKKKEREREREGDEGAARFDIVFINDGSFDNSVNLIKKILKNNFVILNHKINKGYGAAVKTAFKYALKKNYKYFIIFPSDNQRRLKDIFVMLNLIKQKKLDYVVGSKFHLMDKIPLYRKKGNLFFSFLSKLWLNKTSDVLSGFKIYCVNKALGKIILNCPNNYSFDLVLNFYSNIKKMKFNEINVHCDYKDHSSKMNNVFFIFFSMLFDLFFSIKNLKSL
jgi:glycosyltransferase involved in cell wall biosynthesis